MLKSFIDIKRKQHYSNFKESKYIDHIQYNLIEYETPFTHKNSMKKGPTKKINLSIILELAQLKDHNINTNKKEYLRK